MDIVCLVFDEMFEWDVVFWNVLILGYLFNGFDYEVFEVLYDIWVKGIKFNVNILVSIIFICICLRFLYLGRFLYGCVVKYGFDYDILLILVLILMYLSDGDICVVEWLFVYLFIKNVVIWNFIIYVYI